MSDELSNVQKKLRALQMGVILPEEDSELLGVLPKRETNINHDAKNANSYDRVVKQLAGLQMENKKLEQYKALLDA